MDNTSNLIWLPYNLDILSFIDGKNSIQDITNATHLSYKTVFLRIKEMESAGILVADAPDYSAKKYKISDIFHKQVESALIRFKGANITLSDKDKKNIIPKLLKGLRKKRLINMTDLLENFSSAERHLIPTTLLAMEHSGLIKRRIDITKKGICFLKKMEGKND